MLLNILIVVFSLCLKLSAAQESCRTPNGEIAYCISIHDCHKFRERLNGLTPRMKRFFQESQCGFERPVKVCCGSLVDYVDLEEPEEECGQIYGDKYASELDKLKINEHPWTALIEYRNNEGSTGHHCGAVLINKNFALTAAHCVYGDILRKFGNVYQIRLGEYDRSTDKDCVDLINGDYKCFNNTQNIAINNTLIHPNYDYNSRHYLNDIALIKLANPAFYNDFVRPVCLSNTTKTTSGIEYSVVGFGINENSRGELLKHEVKTYMFQNQPCSEIIFNNTTTKNNLIPSQFCAVKSGQDDQINYCGDAGGAILKKINNETSFILQGIESFSFSQNDDLKNNIIVYTNVNDYIEWITDKMRL